MVLLRFKDGKSHHCACSEKDALKSSNKWPGNPIVEAVDVVAVVGPAPRSASLAVSLVAAAAAGGTGGAQRYPSYVIPGLPVSGPTESGAYHSTGQG